ncbi:1,2-phenylacetyl-CoA epoxidase subunit PaaD [Nocardia miyunensis]|uniref:1,2-phenylacetyl-CoA epoxidase subunit PaaD n=1 Tax=Nocardia miyunensis TaxID=282684 RepID=UPI00082C8517|nr:1,2-phenylacetyl-CoA epoxidase subunit PaaD [Nocardia miyunensis]
MTADPLDTARELAASVPDPEMPMLTLADLGVLRDVRRESDGTVVVAITPTYSGCPAMAEIRADIARTLRRNGYPRVRVDTVLAPAWTTDWITQSGRHKLRESGYSPPGRASPHGPVALMLGPPPRNVTCPRCDSTDTQRISEFGATACKAMYRCRTCHEPFDHFKEI